MLFIIIISIIYIIYSRPARANSKSLALHTYPKTPESNPRYAVLSVQSVPDSPTAVELDDLSA